MTCVVGLERKGEVYLGCDSVSIRSDYSVNVVAEPKVFSNGELLMGMCGSFRLGQLLQYDLVVPDRDPRILSDMQYLVTKYIGAVRAMLDKGGHMELRDSKEEWISQSSSYLLGYRGKLYAVHSNFQVLKIQQEYQSIGCGEKFALGALFNMKNSSQWNSLKPEVIITKALDAACHHSAGCIPPYHIFKLDKNNLIQKLI